jgi:hypothetical protein
MPSARGAEDRELVGDRFRRVVAGFRVSYLVTLPPQENGNLSCSSGNQIA